ncbi:hypothetical protein ACIP5Y_31495 [Nocardia sp. NPDC088792]|uniref:hypothetical protein n=1 Tax=Nocardia sp. NPDC088792 TaxID=3364332 RepID=UPI00381E724C
MTYILSVGETKVAELGAIFDQLGPNAKEVIMSTAERLRAEGEARGEVRGRAEALLELLVVKFGALPSSITDVVRGADATQLRVWAARVLSADSLNGVFQE